MKITTLYCDMPRCPEMTSAETASGWTVWVGKYSETAGAFGQYHVCPKHDGVLPGRVRDAAVKDIKSAEATPNE